MIIGADVYHKRSKNSVAAVIASLDQNITKFHSKSMVQPTRGQEIFDNISNCVLEMVESYRNENKGQLPTTISFYRDGVGRGQFELVQSKEVARITLALKEKYGENAPKLDFILVNKRINDRFAIGKDGAEENPESGTIINSQCTRAGEHQFFMVAQKVTQGTATPTCYTFLQKQSNFSDDLYFELTYGQTFNYSGWTGPVKVPAVCQYAHKLAYMVGDNLLAKKHKHQVDAKLEKTLWFA